MLLSVARIVLPDTLMAVPAVSNAQPWVRAVIATPAQIEGFLSYPRLVVE